MEQTQSLSVGNLRQTSSLFVFESAFYLYAYIHVEKYILNVCKVVNSWTKGRIPIFIKQKYSHLTSFLREEGTSFYPSAKTIDHTVQRAEYQFLQFQSLILYTI